MTGRVTVLSWLPFVVDEVRELTGRLFGWS